MRAIRRTGPGVMSVVDVDEPVAGAGEVIVEVDLAGVNPFDAQVLRGQIGADPAVPLTLGAEGVGTIDGERVLVIGGGLGSVRDGMFAERVAVPAAAVRPIAAGVDPRAAATVGVAGRTAWRAVKQLAAVGEGDVVLVLGASGGVGMFAAQLARGCGAEVIAVTGSEVKAERLAAMGLETVVADDPAALLLAAADRGVSVVLDPLGGDYVASLLPSLAPRARVVSYGVLAGRTATFDLLALYGRGVQLIGTSGGTTPPEQAAEAIVGAMEAVQNGTVVVDHEVLPLNCAAEAFDRLAQRTVTGKLLLAP